MILLRFFLGYFALPAFTEEACKNDDPECKNDTAVLTLTPETFKDAVKVAYEERPMLVMFHVEWCGACKRTFPLFSEAAQEAKEQGIKATFAHVECTSDKTMVNSEGIQGFPTLRMYAYNRIYTYRDPRSVKGFLNYMRRMTKPLISENVNWDEEFNNTRLGGIFVQNKTTPAFEHAALELRDQHLFAVAPLPKGVPQVGTSVIASPPETLELVIRTTNDFTIDWAEKNRFPGVWIGSDYIFYPFTHDIKPSIFVAVDYKKPDSWLHVKKSLLEFEKTKSYSCNIGIIDNMLWDGALADFNIYATSSPRVIIFQNNLTEWIEDEFDLTLEVLLESKDCESLQAKFYSQSKSPINFIFLRWRGLRNALRAVVPKETAYFITWFLTLCILAILAYYVFCFCRGLCEALREDLGPPRPMRTPPFPPRELKKTQ